MKDGKVDHKKRLQSSFINFGKFNSCWKFVLVAAGSTNCKCLFEKLIQVQVWAFLQAVFKMETQFTYFS